MRVPGQDELGQAEPGVFLDPVGHLDVAADQRRPGAAAEQANAGPQVRRHLQVVRRAAVQVAHPALAFGLAAAQPLLHGADHRLVDALDQPVGLHPRLVRGVPGDDVQPDAVAQRAPGLAGQAVHPAQLGVHGRRRFAPGQVDVGVAGRDRARLGRGAAEVQVGHRVGPPGQPGALDPQVLAAVADGLAAPQPGHDVQELPAPGVPLLLVEEVAVGLLLGGLAAGHHVEQQQALRVALERGRHLRGQRRGDQAGAERDQELQPLGDLGEHCRRQPGVLTPGAGRGERGLEAELFGTAGDLAQVGQARRADRARRAGRDAVPAADDVAAVAVGRQEPVEAQRHPSSLRLNTIIPIDLVYRRRTRPGRCIPWAGLLDYRP